MEEATTVVPFSRDLVSWPESAGRCELLTALPPDQRILVSEGFESLLRPAGVSESGSGAPRAYWDSVLSSDRSEYVGFVKELLKRSMVSFFDQSGSK